MGVALEGRQRSQPSLGVASEGRRVERVEPSQGVMCQRVVREREDGPGTVSVWFLEGRGRAQQCGCGLGGATAKPTQLKRCQRGERNKVRWGTM